jgi:uncharacterized protein (TIGR02271 family)
MTPTSTRTVVGVFDDRATAQSVVEQLVNSGFNRSSIEVNSHDSYASDVARGGAGLTGETHDHSGGGIGGFLRRIFGNDVRDDYGHYAEAVRRGSTVVAVNTDEQNAERAADILDSGGAVDIDRRAQSWKQRGYTGFQETAAPYTRDEIEKERRFYDKDHEKHNVPVVQEEIEVGKRTVRRGGVRVFNRFVEEPVEKQINLREEHVRVDRRATDRPATESDLRGGETIEVTEYAEEPVVGKRSRVVEEVMVDKETTNRTETIRDTVRRKNVDVERFDGKDVDYSDDFRNDFQKRYASTGATYDAYAPSYQYGYRMASDDRYRGKRWEDVETQLRSDYERTYPNSKWEQMKDSIRYGWNKVTGRT